MDIKTAVESRGVTLKQVASTRGGEFAGPCLKCGGTDRFRCHPNRDQKKKVWFCRQCNDAGGDLIEFFRWCDGMTYKEACRAADMDPKEYTAPVRPRRPTSKPKSEVSPTRYADPAELWIHKADKFATWAHEQLLENREQLAYLADRRGIGMDTVKRFKLGFNPGENGRDLYRSRESWGLEPIVKKNGRKKPLWIPRGIVIPHYIESRIQRIKVRRLSEHLRSPDDERYWAVAGSSASPMLLGKNKKAQVIIETDLDSLMVYQAVGDLVGVISLGSANNRPDARTHAVAAAADVVLCSLDHDPAGIAGMRWWVDHYPKVRHWPSPFGKDPGDSIKRFDIREWILTGLPPVYHVRPSPLDRVSEGEAADQGGEAGKEKAVEQKKPKLPESVERLGALLKRYPVWIINTDERTAIQQAKGFHNEPVLAKISSLVFYDQDCMDHIANHPADRIDRKNFQMWRS